MKVHSNHQLIFVSIVALALAVASVYTLQELAPDVYNGITGAVVTRVNLTGVGPADCNFILYDEWNLVSFFCVSDFMDLPDAIGSLTNLAAMFGYEKGDGDPWKAYKPDLPLNVVNDLTYVSKKKGYWIRMNGSENYFLNGTLAPFALVTITEGYQLVGYPNNETEPIPEVFLTINNSYTKVVSQNPVNQTILTYIVGVGGTLNETRPYRGYWINATTSDTWVVS
ncbi:hypothetical protein ACFL1B_02290 [Nanoarchaeota archaeon]